MNELQINPHQLAEVRSLTEEDEEEVVVDLMAEVDANEMLSAKNKKIPIEDIRWKLRRSGDTWRNSFWT